MALPIPPNGKAVGQFIAAVEDGPDAGAEPDIIGVRGTAIFTATVSHIPVPGAEPTPYTLLPRKRVGVFDSLGFLCTPQTNAKGEILLDDNGKPLISEAGVTLVSTELDGAAVTGWSWSVSLRLTDEAGNWEQTQPAFFLPVPAGGEVDITDYMTVPAASPTGTDQMRLLVDKAERAAALASLHAGEAAGAGIEAADAAQAAALAAASAGQDAAVARQVKEDADLGMFVPNFTVGTVASLPPTGTASASIQGTTKDPILNLSLVQGVKGDTGIGWNPSPLGNTHLDSLITLGTHYQPDGVNGTIANGYPTNNWAGAIEVYRWGGSANLVFQRASSPSTALDRIPGFWIRRNRGSQWTPWQFFPMQRVDNTAGRAIYTWDDTANREQLIYGDTGWRRIDSNSIVNKIWTTTNLNLRRVGNIVEFLLIGVGVANVTTPVDLQGFSAIGLEDIPQAWRPASNAYFTGFGRFNQNTGNATPRQYVMAVMRSTGGLVFERDETSPNGVLVGPSSSIYISGSYSVTTAWPTTLPGVA